MKMCEITLKSEPDKMLRQWQEALLNIVFYSVVIGICFIVLYPLIKLLPSVFSDLSQIGEQGSIWIPKKFSIDSFKLAVTLVYGDAATMLTTIVHSIVASFIQMFMSALMGYAIARENFWYTKIMTALVILVMIVPQQAILIFQYISFKQFSLFGLIPLVNGGNTVDLINNPLVLLMINFLGFGVKQSVFVFMFRQYFNSFPTVLEEAARIDGCGYFKTYLRIAFPNAKPIIMVVLTLSLVWNYGDTYYTGYFYPDGAFAATKLSSLFQWSNRNLVSQVAERLFGVHGDEMIILDAAKHAAVLLYILPLLIFYLLIQRNLVQNFENSGIVG